MPTARLTQTIASPIHQVFEAIINLEQFPRWNRTIAGAEKKSAGPIGEGTVFEMEIRGFGKQTLTLRDFRPGQHVLLEPASKMFSGGHHFQLTATAAGTRVDHVLVMRPRGFFWLMWPMMALMSKKNLRETAADLEQGLAPQPALSASGNLVAAR